MAANKLVAQFSTDELGLLNALQKQGVVAAVRNTDDGQFTCWARYLDKHEPVTATGGSKIEAIRQAATALGATLPEQKHDEGESEG